MTLLHGFKDGAWVRNPIVFGYSDALWDYAENLALAIGANNVDMTPVPAGEAWWLFGATYRFNGTITGISYVLVAVVAAVEYELFKASVTNDAATMVLTTQVILPAGAFLRWKLAGVTVAGDDWRAWARGYKMRIAP